ncbi:hypothetical protein Bpfe_012321 [Biomphalaria pfeifferi]|uniref:Uncharacterized protein n=1 Tax=Biomphalaria pfeifferi TaxID=112525 RepID=A0AAD8BR38_BIOPF|nr:hypothetical protein Bpfe_012321 [Biomphalaria pfeifferi]
MSGGARLLFNYATPLELTPNSQVTEKNVFRGKSRDECLKIPRWPRPGWVCVTPKVKAASFSRHSTNLEEALVDSFVCL